MKASELIIGGLVAGIIGLVVVGMGSSSSASASSENYRGVTCNYAANASGSGWSGTATAPAASGGTTLSAVGVDLPSTKTALHAEIDAAIAAGTFLPSTGG